MIVEEGKRLSGCKMKRIQLDTTTIHDWSSFHQVFKAILGFPEFYGANMDAWIDCMSCLRDPTAEMSQVTVEPDEIFSLEVLATGEFKKRCPEQFNALVECTAIVNRRCANSVLSLVFL